MKQTELTIRAGAFQGFYELVSDLGSNPYQILRSVGLDLMMLEAPDNQVPVQYYRLALNRAAEVTGERNFGLLMSQRQSFDKFGVLGYLARHAPTIEVMISNIDQYLRTHDMASVTDFRVTNKTALLTLRQTSVAGISTVQHTELAMGLVVKLVRIAVSKNWKPHAMYLERMRPDDCRVYQRVFGCPVYFGSSASGLEFPAEELQTPLATSDPGLYALLHTYVDQIDTAQKRDFTSVVRDRIAARLDNKTTALDDIASSLSLTPSQLQRKLKEEGVSFQDVLQDVRYNTACQYLSTSDMNLASISSLVGYSEPAIFTRAFKRKSGATPSQWRKAMRERAS